MAPRRVLAIFTLALLGTMMAPTLAQAAEYTVNSTGDQPDEVVGSGGCKTAVDTCTLRAAIEESNTSVGVNDTIKFSSSFNGEIGDTIDLATSLPTITDRVRIEGFPTPIQCETDYSSMPGPCVGIDGPASGPAFRVAAERVILIGVAISDAQTAIEAVGAPGLETWNDWFGIKLDGSAGPIETGISIDQDSNGADVGGASSVARDIFAHNSKIAVDVDGADYVTIRGNGFGVLPDGNTLAANGKNIEITDAATGENEVAKGNWIGGLLTDEELTSSTCDGECNVIAGALESGIDLQGEGPSEQPASGLTRILGNYIGLNALGTTGIPNTVDGVLVGSANNVTIGGPWPGDRNLINGGADGVLAGSNAANLAIEGNWIGLDPSGTAMLAPPTGRGIAIESGYQNEVSGNRIAMLGGTAIEAASPEAVVRSNVIGKGLDGEELLGAAVGIHLLGSCYICNLLYDNTVANAGEYGLLVESSRNHIYGNRIEGSGAAGIRIKDPGPFGVSRNVIGGDSASEENTISASGGPAVEVILVTPFGLNTRNEIARNHGAANAGPFIKLVNGANGEIAPPVFMSSTQSGASGGGVLPGATVRVFRKATSAPGEIESFLAEDTADEGGSWEVTYPISLPPGTIVAATQTRLITGTATPEPPDGTSELAFSTTTAPTEEENERTQESDGTEAAPPLAASTPPDTKIFKYVLRSRPPIFVFRFHSSEPESTFHCRLDKQRFHRCPMHMKFRRLKPGRHVLRVFAVDAAGNKDATPAVARFWTPRMRRMHHRTHKRHRSRP
jgi:CSLREA domain-containing protein